MFEQNDLKLQERVSLQLNNRSNLPALLLLGSGLTFLAANLLNIQLLNYLWPFFVIVPGMALLWPAFDSTRENQSVLNYLAVPGAVIVLTGLLLFIMSLFNHFEAFAYSWTLFPASAAAGLMYAQRFHPESRVHQAGPKLMRMSANAFLVLAVLFELLIFNNPSIWIALLLIGSGTYLLIDKRPIAK